MSRQENFSLPALYAALDAERQARGLSWSEATKEMNGQSQNMGVRGLSPSTVGATRFRRTMEADGILQMLRWIDRAPESFVGGDRRFEEGDARLPEVPPRHVLRFDTTKLHAALEVRRVERKMSWDQVGREVGVGKSSLMRLSRGGRTSFPQVMRIVGWLGEPAARFTRIADR